MTPPVAPKMTDAPVDSPSAGSKSSSGRSLKRMPARSIMRASSRVVMEMSMSGMPSPAALMLSRPTSNFFAVQGITDTETMLCGSRPIFSA